MVDMGYQKMPQIPKCVLFLSAGLIKEISRSLLEKYKNTFFFRSRFFKQLFTEKKKKLTLCALS